MKIINKLFFCIIYSVLILILIICVLQRVSNNKISFCGYRIFRVISQSMVPKYDIGDVLLIKKTSTEKIKVGDDIVYLGKVGNLNNKFITHQVIQIKKNSNNEVEIITKGIANLTEDPMINENQVYGVVVGKLNILSFITRKTMSISGFLVMIVIPMVILIICNIKSLFFELKNK